ncbi:hypothetical protein Tdes44962_MAKER02300 [Teratosphaeria destructans]|uniref:Uncharacterized protein n=1 Tax=Teratosphaeria destructans TaxID=418781 RepID=A0A9W7SU13_9PEZI|nr:hypothetical protein Tdes44962_MAKER02300 [Teratosphaeria destructans]
MVSSSRLSEDCQRLQVLLDLANGTALAARGWVTGQRAKLGEAAGGHATKQGPAGVLWALLALELAPVYVAEVCVSEWAYRQIVEQPGVVSGQCT